MIFQREISAALLFFFLTAATACFTTDNRNARTGGDSSNGSGAANVSASPTESDVPRILEAKWYEDADGNAIPDFIEVENGYDPAKDDCDPFLQCGEAATGEDLNIRPQNALLILDSSGSMRASAGGGKSKLEAAKAALASYVSTAPARVRFGFMVYGHKGSNQLSGKAESCASIDLLAPFGEINKANAKEVLSGFQPVGWTPIGAALEKAREAFQSAENADNRIILVSDGIETCGGNPVAVAEQLHNEGFKVTVDVVGFNVSSNDAAQLRKIAEAGGGVYTDAKTQADLNDYFKKQSQAFVQTIGASNCYYEAFNKSGLCDVKLVNAAIMKINNIMSDEKLEPYGETKDKWRAYEDIRQRINKLRQERRAKLEVLIERARELHDKAYEINRQTLEGYDKIKPKQ